MEDNRWDLPSGVYTDGDVDGGRTRRGAGLTIRGIRFPASLVEGGKGILGYRSNEA